MGKSFITPQEINILDIKLSKLIKIKITVEKLCRESHQVFKSMGQPLYSRHHTMYTTLSVRMSGFPAGPFLGGDSPPKISYSPPNFY